MGSKLKVFAGWVVRERFRVAGVGLCAYALAAASAGWMLPSSASVLSVVGLGLCGLGKLDAHQRQIVDLVTTGVAGAGIALRAGDRAAAVQAIKPAAAAVEQEAVAELTLVQGKSE